MSESGERLIKLEARERHMFDIYEALGVPFGADVFAAIKALRTDVDRIRAGVYRALCELGVPQPGYPMPVANAHDILLEAMVGADEAAFPGVANLRSPPAESEPLEIHVLHCGRGDGACRWQEFPDGSTSTGGQLRCVVHGGVEP